MVGVGVCVCVCGGFAYRKIAGVTPTALRYALDEAFYHEHREHPDTANGFACCCCWHIDEGSTVSCWYLWNSRYYSDVAYLESGFE